MPEFLDLLPPGEALDFFLAHWKVVQPLSEKVPTESALERVTSQVVYSPEDLPAFARSTVDGYATMAMSTFGASDSLPAYLNLVGEVPMGGLPGFGIQMGEVSLIHTGGMLPAGADAVVMLEHAQFSRPGEIEVMKAVASGENILKVGEDVAAGQVVIPAGRPLRPVEIGGLMALGITEVEVIARPKVGIISSGDEVIPPFQKPQPGQVRDINTYSLGALVSSHGGYPANYGIVPDDAESLRRVLALALEENDMVVITAGSSASTRDLTASVINEIGAPGVLVHGVNVRPGKPTILAVCNGKPVVGLPGNPVSALVIARLFVVPALEKLLGLSAPSIRPGVLARLTLNIPSQAGREDWIPVRLMADEDGYNAEPIFFKSNLIFMLANADGLVHISAAATGVEVGAWVQVEFI